MPIEDTVLVYGTHQIYPPQHICGRGIDPSLVSTVKNNRYCLVYLWLNDLREFWFYLTADQDDYLYGSFWNQSAWHQTRIHMSQIKTYF